MNIENTSEKAILKPKGDLTIFEASEFRDALVELSQSEQPLELDLSIVERMDSSGVQLIMAVRRDLTVTLVGVSSAIHEKFESVGCEGVLDSAEIHENSGMLPEANIAEPTKE